jgi:hypothetical protein
MKFNKHVMHDIPGRIPIADHLHGNPEQFGIVPIVYALKIGQDGWFKTKSKLLAFCDIQTVIFRSRVKMLPLTISRRNKLTSYLRQRWVMASGFSKLDLIKPENKYQQPLSKW